MIRRNLVDGQTSMVLDAITRQRLGPTEHLGVSRATLYRYLAEKNAA